MIQIRMPRWYHAVLATRRGPMIVVPYTFQCKELLFVLARMLPQKGISEHGTVLQAAAQLANTLSREVVIVDDQELLVVLDDPFEAIATAKAAGLRLERCIASPLALELVRDGTWDWLCRQLGLEGDAPTGIVKLPGLSRDGLPDGVDVVPDGPGVWVWQIAPADRVVFVDRTTPIGKAEIVPFGDTWAIADRGSQWGTYVDDRKCSSRCLVPGMMIRIDDVTLIILSVR
jgi:hypothetical protein